VAKEYLKVGCALPEGVGGDKFIYLGEAGGLLDGFLPKAYSAGWFRGCDGVA